MTTRTFVAGIVAGMAMAMIEMMYEGLWGIGLWAPPVAIAAVVLRALQALALPIHFMLVPAALGMMIHLVNSVVLGLIFVLFVAPRVASGTGRIMAGALYGFAIFLLMWFFVLPLVDPLMLNLNSAVFAMTHLVWGGVLGFLVRPRNRMAVA